MTNALIMCSYRVINRSIDEFKKWAWPSITSFIDHALQINVGQKIKENQWRVADLQEFPYTALLY